MAEADPGPLAGLAAVAEVAIADAAEPEALPRLAITEPTVQMTLGPNTSPFAGLDGKAITSRMAC